MITNPTLRERLQQIADDPTWPTVLRAEARNSPPRVADSFPAHPDDVIRAVLVDRIEQRRKQLAAVDNINDVRARLANPFGVTFVAADLPDGVDTVLIAPDDPAEPVPLERRAVVFRSGETEGNRD